MWKVVFVILSVKSVLERYLSSDEVIKIRKCFAGLYELNDDSILAAIEHPEHFVLKPQREEKLILPPGYIKDY